MTASVVIPVHNHATLTRRCLDTLLGRPRPVSTDIVVVDDGSTDVTPELLARYDDEIHVVRHRDALGFARACNAGARAARGELLVFLNNDTIPQPGWLEHLVAYASKHPEAAVVGARLLYPDGTVQHAGVAIGRDGVPYHIYARFPGDHPAVTRPRRFQAVTGACMLVRRTEFTRASGFDYAYSNGWEDIDLCLRIAELGAEVHYCPASVVVHFESATRDTRAPEVVRSACLFRERWAGRVRPDDLQYYAQDELLAVRPADCYPFELFVDPRIATVDQLARVCDVEALLAAQSRRLHQLERETLRLSVALAETVDALATPLPDPVVQPGDDSDDVLLRYQHLLSGRTDGRFLPSPSLVYRRLVRDVREVIMDAVSPGATVAVVTRGDNDLLKLGERVGLHFPADGKGEWIGHHPGDLAAVLAHLRLARDAGAGWFALPSSAAWWLDHYEGLRDFLARGEQARSLHDGPCAIWSLQHLAASATSVGGTR